MGRIIDPFTTLIFVVTATDVMGVTLALLGEIMLRVTEESKPNQYKNNVTGY